jgi:hypothetical protein
MGFGYKLTLYREIKCKKSLANFREITLLASGSKERQHRFIAENMGVG